MYVSLNFYPDVNFKSNKLSWSVYLSISGIILTYFQTLVALQIWMRNQVSVCFWGHPIVNSYFRYQSSTLALDNKTTEWSRKNAESSMHCHVATVCSRISRFSSKCSEKITVYPPMQNLYRLVKYSLINSRNWIHVMSDITLHVNMAHLTVEDRLLIKTSQTEKARLLKNDCWVSVKTVRGKWHRLNGSDQRRSNRNDSNIQ